MNKIQYQKLLLVTSQKAKIYVKEKIGVSTPAKIWPEEKMFKAIERFLNPHYQQELIRKQKEELEMIKLGKGAWGGQYNNLFSMPEPDSVVQDRDIIFYLTERVMTQALNQNGVFLDYALDLAGVIFDEIIQENSNHWKRMEVILRLKSGVEENEAMLDALKLDEARLEKYLLEASLRDEGKDNQLSHSLGSGGLAVSQSDNVSLTNSAKNKI